MEVGVEISSVSESVTLTRRLTYTNHFMMPPKIAMIYHTGFNNTGT